MAPVPFYISPAILDVPVDCLLSAWAATGNCSAECGGGQQTWVRTITREAEHGGRECSTNTTMVRVCNNVPCLAGMSR